MPDGSVRLPVLLPSEEQPVRDHALATAPTLSGSERRHFLRFCGHIVAVAIRAERV
jgi:hypothetical protein